MKPPRSLLALCIVILLSLQSGCTSKKPQTINDNRDSLSWSDLHWMPISPHPRDDTSQIVVQRMPRPEIPDKIQLLLDSAYLGWRFMTHLDIVDIKTPAQRRERFECFPCNLNGDSVADYALAIIAGSDTMRAEWFLAFVSRGSFYHLFPLAQFKASLGIVGGSEIVVHKAGERIPDFDKLNDSLDEAAAIDLITTAFATDALTLMPVNGCCPTTFIFENGHFREFTSGD